MNVEVVQKRLWCSGPTTFGGSFGWFRVCLAPPKRATETLRNTTAIIAAWRHLKLANMDRKRLTQRDTLHTLPGYQAG
jgi:hypothetical protein